ncbi:TVP38/TMEM64 family protein [Mycobacterium sp. C3-094]
MVDTEGTPDTSRRRHVLRLALFVAVLGALFYLTAIRQVIDVATVRSVVESAGPLAPLVYVAVSSVLGAVLVPGPLLAGGSGFLFGPVLGTFVTLGATVGSAVLTSVAGRRAGRNSAHALLGPERSARVDALIRRGGLWAVVGQRFVPGINDALASYTFGAFGVPVWQMAAGALIGSAPKAFAYTALGSTLGSFSAPLLIAAIAVWCVTAGAGAYAAHRGWRAWRSKP